MKKIILSIVLLSFINVAFSQFDIINKVKQVKDEGIGQFAKGKIVEYLKKSRDDYDVTDFNYAVAFSDNSGMFDSQEKFDRFKKGVLYVLDPESAKDATQHQRARDLNDVGEMFFSSNQYKMAETAFNRALKLYNDNGLSESKDAIKTISNLGLVYQTTGRYALAKEFNEKALKLRSQGNEKDEAGLSASYNNLGVLYKDMGLYNESEDNLLKAQDISKKQGAEKTSAHAIIMNNLAMLYQITGKYKESEELLKKSIEIGSKELKKKSVRNYVRLQVNLAILYQATKRYDEAEKIYMEAKKQFSSKNADYATLSCSMAGLYQLKGDTKKVEELLKEALKIFEKKFGTLHPLYASTSYALASSYQASGRLDEALPLLLKAAEIQKNQLGQHHPSFTSTNENLAILYWQKNDLNKATEKYNQVLDEYIYQINTYFSAMNEYEKGRFWEKIHPKFIRYFTFAIEAYKTNPEIAGNLYNYHIATKALLLTSTRKVKMRILNSGDKEMIELYTRWSDLKSYIAKLYTYSKEDLKQEHINLDSLENVSKGLEKDLSKKSSHFKQGIEQIQVTFNDISSNLGQGEAALEFIRVTKYRKLLPDTSVVYATLVLTNNKKAPKMFVFKNGHDMELSCAAAYKKAIGSGKNMEVFYNYYWKGVDSLVGNAKKLYTSVDGIFNQVNLNTILLPSKKYLVDEKNIIYLTNSKDLIELKKKPKSTAASMFGKTAVLVGFPDYKLGLSDDQAKIPPLPGTKVELEGVVNAVKIKNWKTQVFLGKDATEENVKKVNSPFVLHIATHGFFRENVESDDNKFFGIEIEKAAENPLLRSGLMLAGADKMYADIENNKESKDKDDGILNAFEAMIMNLDGTELVILSACETGLGTVVNGEGVYGLQRSFQIAGTSSVLMSLWEVSDEGTQNLMQAFYKYWLLTGDKHEAILKAQIEMKEKFKFPFFWGAFVLVSQ